LTHFNGAQHASKNSFFFECILERQGIEHGGEHAHVIAGRAVNFKALLPRAAKNVSAAYHDGDLDAQSMNFFQLARNGLNRFAVDAEPLWALHRFTRKFQENAPVCRLRLFPCSLRHAFCLCHSSPAAAHRNHRHCNKLWLPSHNSTRNCWKSPSIS
jgi:hypothetical protein